MPTPAPRFAEILVVEDTETERHLLCDILQTEGFHAIGCESGKEALRQVRQRRFGVAIVDLRLPDIHGTDLLEQVRKIDDQVQVIIYTGAASFDSVKEAINLGAFAYVEKLGSPAELLRHVHRAFRERVHRYATELESAVRHRTEQLARSNRELEGFASIVAHDLRSPLLTVSGYCQILQEEYKARLDPTARQYLEHIEAGIQRMSDLISDLLDYSRVGRTAEPLQPVDLDAVVAEALANLDADVRQAAAQVTVEPLPTVAAVRAQMLQLFQNLLGNAIKFHGAAAPMVRVRCTREKEYWQVAVEDNGIGIDPEHFDRIFQVFQRLYGREYAGTGIGLALCKKIVELHGGRIWLTSEVGRGTTFFFTLADTSDSPASPG